MASITFGSPVSSSTVRGCSLVDSQAPTAANLTSTLSTPQPQPGYDTVSTDLSADSSIYCYTYLSTNTHFINVSCVNASTNSPLVNSNASSSLLAAVPRAQFAQVVILPQGDGVCLAAAFNVSLTDTDSALACAAMFGSSPALKSPSYPIMAAIGPVPFLYTDKPPVHLVRRPYNNGVLAGMSSYQDQVSAMADLNDGVTVDVVHNNAPAGTINPIAIQVPSIIRCLFSSQPLRFLRAQPRNSHSRLPSSETPQATTACAWDSAS